MGMPTEITVQGTFLKPDGTPESGAIQFHSRVYVLEDDGTTAVSPGIIDAPLDNLGRVSVAVPATDDPEWTSNWRYDIVMRLSNDYSTVRNVVIPYNSPGGVLSITRLIPSTPDSPIVGNYIPLAAKGAPNGVASLDSAGKVPSSQIPASAGGAPDWTEVLNKPTTFPPSAHNHVVVDVTGLQAILDGKQAAGSYAAAVHTHTIANVTGLQTALDAKQVSGDYATNTSLTTGLAAKAPIDNPTFTGTVSGIAKSMVGLANVDNTSDTGKPVSTAQQTALNLKANIASPTFTGTVSGITKSMVGLGSVDNTADTAKPVSTAQQTALDGKAATSHTHAQSDVTGLTAALSAKANTSSLATVATTGDYNDLINKPAGGGGGSAITVKSVVETSVGNITPQNTSGVWQLFTGAPSISIPAAINDYVSVEITGMLWSPAAGSSFLSLGVVVAGSVVRYSSSGTSTPADEGDPTFYPQPTSFRTYGGVFDFKVTSGDLSSGSVSVTFATKGNGVGTLYASAGYPLRWRILNYGPITVL